MSKLGFVVGHPTQFEVPFYRYVNEQDGADSLKVYYYNYKQNIIRDVEMGEQGERSWGIDLHTGYEWCSVSKSNLSIAKQILKDSEYVIVNGYTSSLCLIILCLSRLYGKKVGLRLDTVAWNNKSVHKRFLKMIILNLLSLFVDSFWVTGSKSGQFLRDCFISLKKINTFSYVVDVDWFKQKSQMESSRVSLLKKRFNIPQSNRVILAITKLVERESPQDLIIAFGNTKMENVSLLIVGDGQLRKDLEELASKYEDEKNIVFAGYIPYADLPEIYGISDLYVHPSENEPWGVSVQEAMSCGLPVVTSDFVGSAYDLVREGENGRMYSIRDTAALSNMLCEVLNYNKVKVRTINDDILKKWDYESLRLDLHAYIDNLKTSRV